MRTQTPSTALDVFAGSARWAVEHGDVIERLQAMPAESVDLVVTDPPAGIGFMSKPWDSFKDYTPRTPQGADKLAACTALGLPKWAAGFVAFLSEVWAEVDRVLKPGGFVCAWALPKTSDLTGVSLRATGWDVHESVAHLFGAGMNKAGDLGKQIDKAAGAEREVLVVRERQGWSPSGEGGKPAGITGSKTDLVVTTPATDAAKRWTGWHSQIAPGHEQWLIARKPIAGCTPQELREATGWDHAWSCRALKTAAPKQRAKVAESWPQAADALAIEADALATWEAALERADKELAAALAWVEALARDQDAAAYAEAGEAQDLAQSAAALLRANPPHQSAWVQRSGRSLRPEHRGTLQLRRDGDVFAERAGAKFSKARIKTVVGQLLTRGCGAFNVRACRIPRGEESLNGGAYARDPSAQGTRRWEGGAMHATGKEFTNPSGSHPRNVVLTPGGEGCPVEGLEGCPVEGLDRQSGVLTSGDLKPYAQDRTGAATDIAPHGHRDITRKGDSGGASRFFTRFEDRVGYFGKASDRTVPGLEGKPNKHPTHKHPALMHWLCKLMAPTAEHTGGDGAIVLDPFNGSGTTGVGALLVESAVEDGGLRYIGIEQSAEDVENSRLRIGEAERNPGHYDKHLKRGKYAKKPKAAAADR